MMGGTRTGTGAELRVENVCVRFAGVIAVNDVSFSVGRGELVALIGPNGAGKTTLFNAVTGVVTPSSGSITVDGAPLTRSRRYAVARMGVARTFQHGALVEDLSVIENILIGAYASTSSGFTSALLRLPRATKEELHSRARAEEMIELFSIASWRNRPVSDCPHRIRRRVDLARAMVGSPRLLLLDEPVAGMTAEEKEDIAERILHIRERFSATIVLVEHDLGVVMDLADRIVVMDAGAKIAEGSPVDVRANPIVIAAYVGQQIAPLAEGAATP